jgi:nucleoside-diphosphate-sugar epimerase
MSQSTALILGANGRLGSALVKAFATAGWRVLAQTRHEQHDPSAQNIVGELRDVQALVAAARNHGAVDVVVNAASPLYTRWAQEAVVMNDAAINVAEALGATLMFPGNVYNFGAQLPACLQSKQLQSESIAAQTQKGEIRVQMERAMAAAAERSKPAAATRNTQAIVIRAGDFFGCNAGSWFDMAIGKDVHKGKLTYPGPLDRMHAWAYVPDLAATFVRVAEARHTLAQFEMIDFAGHALTGSDWVQVVERITQRPMKVANMPWGFIRALSPVVPMWREAVTMSYLWQRPHQLVADPAHAHLLAASTPIDQAVRASVQALHPQLRLSGTANSH